MVEIALLSPWIFFLFVGIFDFGFFAYAAIAVENAARAAAIRTAGPGLQTQSDACTTAFNELRWMPNSSSFSGSCASGALVVTQTTLSNTTTPMCADCASGVDPTAISSLVAVTYQSIPLIPIPGILNSQLNLTRTAEVRVIVP